MRFPLLKLETTTRLFAALLMLGVFGVGCPSGDDDDTTVTDDDDSGDDDDATGDDDDATGDDDDATGDDDDATGDDDDATGDDDDATGDDDDATGDDDDSAGDDDDATGDDDDSTTATDTTLFDFEGGGDTFTGFGGGLGAAVADPTDSSNTVAELNKTASAETWAGVTLSFCAGDTIVALPFSATETTLTLDVWSPNAGTAFMVKVEDSTNSGIFAEATGTTTAASTWETITVDYAGVVDLANTYDKLSVFPDFNVAGGSSDVLYYVDDVIFDGAVFSTACGAQPVTTGVPITFDDSNSAYTFTGFGGASGSTVADPAGGGDQVGELIKDGSAQTWAGVTISTGPNQSILPIPLAAGDLEVTVDIYSPVASIPFLLKVEDSADPTIFIETLGTVTSANAWETVTFDFGNPGPNLLGFDPSATYDKISVFPYFDTDGASGAAGTYYVDNIDMAP